MSRILIKPSLAVITNRKLLMVRDNVHGDIWFLLGGKQEQGETVEQCLKREVLEEVGAALDEASLRFLKQFEDVAYGKTDTVVRILLYGGSILQEPKPSSEIVQVGYIDSASDERYLTPISIQILAWLKSQGLID